MTCPICRKASDPAHRPFCSRRCADVDLARWLTGRYVLPGAPLSEAPTDPDEDPSPEG